jgi:hypothetical protein
MLFLMSWCFPLLVFIPMPVPLLRREIPLLPESLENHLVSSPEGEQHCTELTPNDSIIHVLSDSTQVQQRAGENFTQNGEQNEAKQS